jgi:uncharacterized protein (DUF1501 family)
MLRKHTTPLTSEHQPDRRQFLKLGTCGAVTNTALFSGVLNSHPSAAIAAPEIPSSGYKALVCIFLDGGFDGFQALTPFGDTPGDTDYADYAASRTTLSHRREDPANPGNPGGGWDTTGGGQVDGTIYGYLQQISDSATGKKFGLHPRFTFLKQLYNEGRATFCANVGALIEPIADRVQYSLSTTKKPIGLFGHVDMVRHWQTAVPSSRNLAKGWGGKMADFLTDPLVTSAARFYSAISTIGSNVWQTGNRVRPYAITTPSGNNIGGAVVLTGYAPNGSTEYNGLDDFNKAYSDIQNDLVNQNYVDLLEKSILKIRTDARDAAEMFQDAIAFQNGVSGTPLTLPTTMPGPGGVGTVATRPFDASSLGAQLAVVARAIKQRSLLGYASGGRQIFMVRMNGWDHNGLSLALQNNMIPLLDNGLKSFHDFLNAEGLLNDVTTFTMSEFGRTIASNSIGTDHGWGNNMIVMGGALNQGTGGAPRIWGSYPQIKLGTAQSLDVTTRGHYIPTMSTDSYHAELALWFGLPNNTTAGSPLRAVFPNIANFHSGGGSTHPVGFMNF